MEAGQHLERAGNLYQKALEEFERAEDKKDNDILRDTCAKGWLSTMEAANALFVNKGVKEEELPKADRGRRYMVNKYANEELEFLYKALRNDFHVEGYYEGVLDFDEVKRSLAHLDLYIKKVESTNE